MTVSYSIPEEVSKIKEETLEEELRKNRAIMILLRLDRYVSGYLPEYDIDVRKNFESNPLEITIRVYYKKK